MDIVKEFAKRQNVSVRKAEKMVDDLINIAVEGLKRDGSLSIRGIATFKIKHANKRQGINPKTQKKITIPAHDYVSFKVGRELKRQIK